MKYIKKKTTLLLLKKSKTVVFSLVIICLFYLFSQINNPLPQIPKSHSDSTFSIPGTLTTAPSFTINPKDVKATIDNKLSGAPQIPFNFPVENPDYYTFAKKRLFDNQDFWTSKTACTDIPGLVVFAEGPQQATVGDTLKYTITVHYKGKNDVTIDDAYPPSISLINASGTPIISANTISWSLGNNISQIDQKTDTYIFTVNFKAIQNNTQVNNLFCGRETISSTGPSAPPTPLPGQPCSGGDGSGCACDTKYGVAQNNIPGSGNNNGYEVPVVGTGTGRQFCKIDYYCDPKKTGRGFTGAPCTQLSNCTCDNNFPGPGKSTVNFTCSSPGDKNNAAQFYRGSCTNGTTCKDSNAPGFPCQ